MTIAFVHNDKAFLPEIEAYIQFFSLHEIQCDVVSTDELGLLRRNVEWRLMGTDFSKPRESIVKIHEYTSTSVPPWRKWKNWSKSFFNAQPDFRLFLNKYVKNSFNFHDSIPFGYRDMGVPAEWLKQNGRATEKEFDFVYLGDVTAVREPQWFLNSFSTGTMKDRSLLVISSQYQQLQNEYSNFQNITFLGPLKHEEVDKYLRKARFGINFMIDQEPFNKQTSTKFLEYSACSLPVISTEYFWIKDFEKQYGGKYFYIQQGLDNFTWENISNFDYKLPDLSDWTWEQQIKKSGVLDFFKSKFPEMPW